MSVDAEWLALKRVAELLDQSPRTAERTVCRPGFPVAARIPVPRWRKDEVLAWVERQRATDGPRSARRTPCNKPSRTSGRDARQSAQG